MLHNDLYTLALFTRVCECRSISRAAEQMNLAVSAASRRIRLLEHAAGIDLLKRRPHGVEPTAAGIIVLRYAHEMVQLGERLEALLSEHRVGARGHVRVFASSSVLVERLAQDLSDFARENPAIRLDLVEQPSSAILDALYHKQTDIGVIVGRTGVEGLATYPFAKDRLSVALPSRHRLARRDRLRYAELMDEEFISLDGGTAVHRLLVRQARELGRFLKVRVQVRSFEVMCQMIGQGLGIGILPEHAVSPLAAALGLSLVTLEEPWAERDFLICVRAPDALDAPTRRLLDFLRARAGEGSAQTGE